MTLGEDYACIAVGLAGVVTSLFGKNFYYLKGMSGVGRPAPKWAGKLMFAVIGLGFLSIGFYNLFRP